MMILNSGNVVRLALDAVVVGTRMRSVWPAQVQNLLLMAEDTGITTPIHVRKTKAGYELIDGAHRLAAARELGLADIACLVVECRQDEARAMEASNNLGAARMTPLQTAVFVASWKRDYYALHPDRKAGIFKGNQHAKTPKAENSLSVGNKTKNVVTDTMSLTTIMADSFGITERHAHRILAVGERLSPEEITLMDSADRRVALVDLLVLSKISEPADRLEVVTALVADTPLSAAKGWAAIRARKASVKPLFKDPIDVDFRALRVLWLRVHKKAKRRFVAAFWAELQDMAADAGDQK